MKILYYVGFGNWWGAYPPDILDHEEGMTVGGGENCALRTAAGLVGLGHEVTFCSVGLPGTWRGVKFVPQSRYFTLLANERWDAVVSWSVSRVLRGVLGTAGRVLVQQLNDLIFEPGWFNYTDVVSAASETHSRYLRSLVPDTWAQHCRWVPVSNGVEANYFPEEPPSIQDRPLWVGYWSSPDRGLHHLLEAWPRIHKAVPEARLRIYYQVRKYIASIMAGTAGGVWGRAVYLASVLQSRLAKLEVQGVDLIDAIPRKALAKEQVQCRVMTYPCDPQGFTEGFGQAVPESMAAGCLPVVRCTDAFAELWASHCWELQEHPTSDAFLDEIADKTIRGLRGEQPADVPGPAERRAHALAWSWERSAKAVERAIEQAIERRRERESEAEARL